MKPQLPSLLRSCLIRALFAVIAGSTAHPARAQTPATELKKTIVKADRLEMRNDGMESRYLFDGHVRVTGTNLEVTCDRVEIFAITKGSDNSSSAVGTGNIRRMLATGNVTIAQAGQKATCGVAEVLPGEDVIILTEDPVVTDLAKGFTVKGTRMWARRDREIQIENPEVVGPALPNFGPPVPAAPATPGTPPLKPVP